MVIRCLLGLRVLSSLRVITFKASEDLIEAVDKLAKILNVDRSELIRFALLQLLKRDPLEIHRMMRNGNGFYYLDRVHGFTRMVCLELSPEEIIKLRNINEDIGYSIKHLIELIPLA